MRSIAARRGKITSLIEEVLARLGMIKEKKKYDTNMKTNKVHIQYFNCNIIRHYQSNAQNPIDGKIQAKVAQTNLNETETLLMTCNAVEVHEGDLYIPRLQ